MFHEKFSQQSQKHRHGHRSIICPGLLEVGGINMLLKKSQILKQDKNESKIENYKTFGNINLFIFPIFTHRVMTQDYTATWLEYQRLCFLGLGERRFLIFGGKLSTCKFSRFKHEQVGYLLVLSLQNCHLNIVWKFEYPSDPGGVVFGTSAPGRVSHGKHASGKESD